MRLIALCLAFLLSITAAAAQSSMAPTAPLPVNITLGNTYQLLMPAGTNRRSLTIQNNNAADSCYVLIGGPWVAGDTTATSRTVNGASLTAAKASLLLLAGGAYTRYEPYIPSDQILVTCATTNSSIYADVQ